MQFKKRRAKNDKKKFIKGLSVWKFGWKYSRFENILKKGRWLPAIIARNKLLEKALTENIIHNLVGVGQRKSYIVLPWKKKGSSIFITVHKLYAFFQQHLIEFSNICESQEI